MKEHKSLNMRIADGEGSLRQSILSSETKEIVKKLVESEEAHEAEMKKRQIEI